MLLSIMMGNRYGRILSIILPAASYLAGWFDFDSLFFALLSSVLASFVLHDAKKRIDMVKAGVNIALVNTVAAAAILFIKGAHGGVYAGTLILAALNGLASGMLVLGITPILENILHSATAFRPWLFGLIWTAALLRTPFILHP
jgi:membrane-associated HD superfamily phosphohydrolase